MSDITVYTDDVIYTTTKQKEFTELVRFFGEAFEIKDQKGSVPKYLNFCICESPIVFIIDHTYHIMEIVN